MKTRTSILLGYIALIALLILTSIGGLMTTRSVSSNFEGAILKTLPVIGALQEIRNQTEELLREIESSQHRKADTRILTKSPGIRDTLPIRSSIAVYRGLVTANFPDELDTVNAISAKVELLLATLAKSRGPSDRNNYEQARTLANELIQEIEVATRKEFHEFNELNDQIKSSISDQSKLMLLMALLSVAIGAWSGRIMLRRHDELKQQVEARTRELENALSISRVASQTASRERSMVEATLEATDNGILVVSREGRITLWNSRFAQMWKLSEETLAAQDDAQTLSHVLEQLENPDQFMAKVKSLYERPDAKSRDTINFKDGRVFARFSHPQRIGDEVVGRVWSFLDITEQRQAEQRILHLSQTVTAEYERTEQQRTQLQTLLSAIPDMVWMKDSEGVFLWANPAFGKLMGASPEQLIGKTDNDFFAPEVAEGFRADDELAATGTAPLVREEWVTDHSNGQRALLETIKTAVRGSDGQLIGVLGIARDITKANELNEELKQARTEAQHANSAKSSFLATMSHEIRTPMNAIIGMSDLCLETTLTDRQRNYLTKIKHASDSLLHIINDILDFSKIEAGKLQMESLPFVLETVFEQLSSVTALKAENQGVELSYERTDSDFVLVGDQLRLGQVLINLVNNALKFSTGGNVVVRTASQMMDDGQVELHLSVSDEGIGIAPEHVANLFQPFTQADSTMTRRFGGTGLGLAICRHLVSLMNGRIWVESELGVGSTFHFTARFTSKGVDRRQGISMLAEKMSEHSDRHVLIVDDSAIARRVLSGMIGQLGLQVQTAESGAEAFALASAAGAPDYLACLVDWRMPGMDGVETIRRLRDAIAKRQTSCKPSMILVTAYSHHDELKGTEAWIDGLIAKPVSARHIYVELARALGVFEQEPPKFDKRKISALHWSRFHGLDFLLVEDIEVNQEVITELLANVGIPIRLARNGVEAITEVSRKMPDVVLMDCEMPVMDGYTATRRLRENAAWKNLPIIALTANATLEDQERCFAAGMTAHVAKPVRMEVLYDRLVASLPNLPPAQEMAVETTPEVTQPDPMAELPPLPGINKPVGLARVGGKISMLVRVLKHFKEKQCAHFEREFNEAFATPDWDTVIRLAHSMKGVAYTLGAIELGDAASVLLDAAKTRDREQTAAELKPVLEKLTIVSDGLNQLMHS